MLLGHPRAETNVPMPEFGVKFKNHVMPDGAQYEKNKIFDSNAGELGLPGLVNLKFGAIQPINGS